MADVENKPQRLKAYFLLDAGRNSFAIAAFASFGVAAISLAVAIVFWILPAGEPLDLPLPAPYKPEPKVISFDALDQRLAPPSNLHFVSLTGSIGKPIKESDRLGYFDATTKNGFAAAPNDILIVGGADASLFIKATDTKSRRSVIVATRTLADQINDALAKDVGPVRHEYHLMLLGYDHLGNHTAPTDITIALTTDSTAQAQEAAQPASVPAAEPMSPLDSLAFTIAKTVHPDGGEGVDFAAAVQIARALPDKCGAGNDPDFLRNYQHAFEHVSASLTPKNYAGVLLGVCDAWRAALKQEQARREHIESLRRTAMNLNADSETEVLRTRLAHQLTSRTALMVLGAALAAFFFTILLLACLSIERHTRALRDYLETVAGKTAGEATQNSV